MLQRTPRRGWGRGWGGPEGSGDASHVRLFLFGLVLDLIGVAAFAFGEGSAITGRADAAALALTGVLFVVLGCLLVWHSGT